MNKYHIEQVTLIILGISMGMIGTVIVQNKLVPSKNCLEKNIRMKLYYIGLSLTAFVIVLALLKNFFP